MHIVIITVVLDFSALVLAEAVLSYVNIGSPCVWRCTHPAYAIVVLVSLPLSGSYEVLNVCLSMDFNDLAYGFLYYFEWQLYYDYECGQQSEYIHIHTLFFLLLVLWSFSFNNLNADFNMTHDFLERSGWPDLLGMVIISAGQPTCKGANGKWTEIDYLMVTSTILSLIHIWRCRRAI